MLGTPPGLGHKRRVSAASSSCLITYRSVLGLALPVMVSNLSTPLLGLVDTAVLGRSPDGALLAAVALGSMVFTFVFWGFGFLRMGTSGIVAQADGAGDAQLVKRTLWRALLLASLLGLALLALQQLIAHAAFVLIDGAGRARALARDYFEIRIWAAPATLANYAIAGFLVGTGRTRLVLFVQLVLNGCNLILDVSFVVGLGWGVAGVAWGSVIAEQVALMYGLWMVRPTLTMRRGENERRSSTLGAAVQWWGELLEARAFKRLLAVNVNLMLRTLALIAVFAFFTVQGARFGETTLAANAILMQLVSLSAYFLDGVASATERLVGFALGQGQRHAFSTAVRRSTVCAVAIAILLSLLFHWSGPTIIGWLTSAPEVRAEAWRHLPWAAWGPVAGVWAFQLDGIYIGATQTSNLRNAMIAALAIFLGAWWALRGWGNHGLWASLFVHYAARALSLAYYYPGLMRSFAAR